MKRSAEEWASEWFGDHDDGAEIRASYDVEHTIAAIQADAHNSGIEASHAVAKRILDNLGADGSWYDELDDAIRAIKTKNPADDS